MQIGQLLHQVDAVAVGPVIIGGREQRDEAQPDLPGLAGRGDHKPIVLRGRHVPRLERAVYFFHFASSLGNAAEAAVVLPSLLSMATVSGPSKPPPARA